ncbi:MAG: hypothetical protein K6G26_05030 [Lachnospiraceae bacterium]|nr:hypothetical protein [Lachnospiraceae bacterium]
MKELKQQPTRQLQILQAIIAGERTLESLHSAQMSLNVASVDNVTSSEGNILKKLVKHLNADDVSIHMNEAKQKMNALSEILGEIEVYQDLDTELKDYMKYTDMLFDVIQDNFMLQTKINEAKIQVRYATRNIGFVIEKLKDMYINMEI